MTSVHLRSIDLNLLVALDALLDERHVTRAAERIGISQPAMSNALGRLRHHLDDNILVRTAVGMEPTPFAEELRAPVAHILRQITHVFDGPRGFDPANTAATLAVRMSEPFGVQILTPLINALRREAPNMTLDIVHLPPKQTIDGLERDDLHLAVSMGLEHSTSIRSETLLTDRMVCVMRKGHPLSARRLTLARFLSAEHLKVSMSPTDRRFVDDVLLKEGHSRRIVLNVPHWLIVPHVLRSSDLISVMPARFAKAIQGIDLLIRELPFASTPFEWRLYQHRRHDGEGAVSWLRKKLIEITVTLKP